MSEHPRPPAEQWAEGHGHETTDVGVALIVKFIIVFALIIAVSMPVLWWLMNVLESRAEKRDPDVPPIADLHREPPGPNLQPAPAADFEKFRDEQLRRLQSTGWVDRNQKIVHIPIERAMELVLKEGMPKAKNESSQRNNSRPSENGGAAARSGEDDRGPPPNDRNPRPSTDGAEGPNTPSEGDEILP